MRSGAAVVVIGGGIIGCSIAYHLTAAGCRDVVLLEKGDLTSGTTFHSVGLVSQFRTSTTDALLMSQSIRLYREIAAEVGEAAGWRPVGSLRLASSETTLTGLRRGVSQARALGLDVALVSSAEALRLCPVMSAVAGSARITSSRAGRAVAMERTSGRGTGRPTGFTWPASTAPCASVWASST